MKKEKQISGTLVIPVSENMALRVHLGEDGIVYCLKDVCDILGKSYKKSRRGIDPANLSWHRTPTEGGMQWMTFITQEHLFEFIDKIQFGKVKGFLDLLTETVLPAVELLLAEYAQSDGESMAEATFHKFDESTDKSTNVSTEQSTHPSTDMSTDMSTEVASEDSAAHRIILEIKLK